MDNGIARGVGPVAKALANVFETAANMALAKIVAGRIEIPLRTGTIAIAGSKGQRQRQQAEAKQLHVHSSFRPLFRSSRDKFQYYEENLSSARRQTSPWTIIVYGGFRPKNTVNWGRRSRAYGDRVAGPQQRPRGNSKAAPLLRHFRQYGKPTKPRETDAAAKQHRRP
jgi:hypothetical protein